MTKAALAIRKYRKDRNLSLWALAEMVGVTAPTVLAWERGTQVSERRLERVSNATGISVAVLRPDLAKHFTKEERVIK
jgi:transcriptional regulator with XRE-family HTH domain